MAQSEEAVPELVVIEQRIVKIKSDIDQFEQVLKRVVNGFGSDKYLNDEYHNLIISTRDLSTHLSNLQKATEASSQNPNLRVRAQDLNGQAISQLRRLQSLGVQVQQYARSGRTDGQAVSNKKYGSPLVDFTADVGKTPPLKQDQMLAIRDLGDEQQAREMEQLESDIVQVNELFTTLATYVHDQGTFVDSIGNNIEVAYEKVEAGTKQLDSAVKHRKSARRKKCICIIIVLVVLLILGLALGLSLKSS
ncbi:unnamed protein product [Calicophoron daubneyi]|uniref:t-SNARE coiled-coil homology domain-containing protein n=1 Tax=Calicophoron daubneyi TaxID=300641 RepID=A0AAV2TY91_CALDB